jgi:transposase
MEQASHRRLVGLDLGITTSHHAVILNVDGTLVARRRCVPTQQSLERLEAAALDGAPEGTRLEVVVEPTGPAWLPVAVFFIRRGHTVFRVSSAKAAALRRFYSRHAKSNRIDADVLARLPLVDPAGVVALELPDADQATLRRRMRAADRLTEEITSRKQRIRDLGRQCYPMLGLAITGELAKADVAVLVRWPDPAKLLRAGEAALSRLIAKVSRGQLDVEQRTADWLTVARESVAVYGSDPAVPFADIGAEIASQARIMAVLVAEQQAHAKAREDAYAAVDPDQLARSLPGVATIGGPVLVAGLARPGRFPNGHAFKSFCGLAPKASETGETDSKGQPISKAGAPWLRDQLLQSANNARRLDPQLAAIYHRQMVAHGAHHQKALTVIAGKLAERFWTVMARGTPYVICDVDGTPVTPEQAKQIITDRYVVPAEVRAQRRSRKQQKGKAPHDAKNSRQRRGDLPHNPSSTPPTIAVNGHHADASSPDQGELLTAT